MKPNAFDAIIQSKTKMKKFKSEKFVFKDFKSAQCDLLLKSP